MKPHELADAIGEQLQGSAADWWRGATSEIQNEYVIEAQRRGGDLAAAHAVAAELQASEPDGP